MGRSTRRLTLAPVSARGLLRPWLGPSGAVAVVLALLLGASGAKPGAMAFGVALGTPLVLVLGEAVRAVWRAAGAARIRWRGSTLIPALLLAVAATARDLAQRSMWPPTWGDVAELLIILPQMWFVVMAARIWGPPLGRRLLARRAPAGPRAVPAPDRGTREADEGVLRQALSAVLAHDDPRSRYRLFEALLAGRLYLTHRGEPQLTGTAYSQPDGSLMLPAFTDEISLRRWISRDTPFGTMPAKTFFRAAVKMGIDDVVIDPGGWAFRVGRDSMILLAQGINPASVPSAPLAADS